MSKVCISVATKGHMHAATVEWLLRAFTQLAPDVVVHLVRDPNPLQHARCEQVRRFLETDCSHIFLLDSDCEPQEGTIQRLLAHQQLIVAAPHPTVKGHEIGLMVLDRDGKGAYVQHRPLVGLQGPNVVVGCAGLLIHRAVFDIIHDPWFQCVYNNQGFIVRTEDFDFCDRAHAAGIDIWADCDLAQRHWIEVPI